MFMYVNKTQSIWANIKINILHCVVLCIFTSTHTIIYHDTDRKCHYVVKSGHQNSIRIIINPSGHAIKGPAMQNIFLLHAVLLLFPFLIILTFQCHLVLFMTWLIFIVLFLMHLPGRWLKIYWNFTTGKF